MISHVLQAGTGIPTKHGNAWASHPNDVISHFLTWQINGFFFSGVIHGLHPNYVIFHFFFAAYSANQWIFYSGVVHSQ